MRTKLPIIAAAVLTVLAIGAVFVGVKLMSNADARVQDVPATTEVATTAEAPATTTTSASDCGLLGTVTIDVAQVSTSFAPGDYALGFVFDRGDRVNCVERVDGLDGCWIEVELPEWAQDDYPEGTRHYLHLGVTKSKTAMEGGSCFDAEAY